MKSEDTEPFIDCRAPLAWSQIAALLMFRLNRARHLNDRPSLSHDETLVLRGEIKTLKDLLDLPNAVARRQEAPPAVLS